MKLTSVIISSTFFVMSFCGVACALDVGGVEIHGWASQGFVQTTTENQWPVKGSGHGSLHLNDYALNVSKQFTDEIHAGIQLFGQDRGYFGNDKIQIDWANVDYRPFDWLGVRVGKVKIPQGLYNETRDNDMLRTPIFLPQGIYNESRRDLFNAMLGGGLYGSVSAGKMGSIRYLAEAGTLDIPIDSGLSAQMKAAGLVSEVTNISSKAFYAGKLDWTTPVEGLRIVGTASYLTEMSMTGIVPNVPPIYGPFAGTTQTGKAKEWGRYVISTEYTWGDLVLAAEYMQMRLKREDYSGKALSKPESYYVGATYRFNDLFELGSYYSTYFVDKDHHHTSSLGFPEYSAWQKDLALTARFDINDYIVFKCEGHYLNGTSMLGDVVSPVQAKQGREDWFMFASKLTVGF